MFSLLGQREPLHIRVVENEPTTNGGFGPFSAEIKVVQQGLFRYCIGQL
jgi:hypothetical protein